MTVSTPPVDPLIYDAAIDLAETIGYAMRDAPPTETDLVLARVAEIVRAHVLKVRETFRHARRTP